MMAGQPHPIIQLLKNDPRYPLEAYQFVRESLAYAQKEFQAAHAQEDEFKAEFLESESDAESDADLGLLKDELQSKLGEDLEADLEDDLGNDLEDDLESELGVEMSEDFDEELTLRRRERHVKGQQLCEAIRRYALDQYGYLAKTVLNSWGVTTTSDFGEIVYNLIHIGLMKKSDDDRRSDFDNVYDFDEAFQRQFRITISD